MHRNQALLFIRTNATLIALVVLALLLALVDPTFPTARNLSNVARQVTIVGIIGVGMTMVILIAGIDLSVGSVVGVAAVVVTLLMQYGFAAWLAVPLALVIVGGVIGLWNGFWIAHHRIPPFIITLGMLTIGRGVALSLSGGSSVPVADPSFAALGSAYIPPAPTLALLALAAAIGAFKLVGSFRETGKSNGAALGERLPGIIAATAGLLLAAYVFGTSDGMPVPVAIFVAIAALAIFVLGHTRFGRRLYALGGNEEAARLSGINVYQTKMIVYVVVSLLSALSGILLASRLNGASPNLGNMFELDAIAAVVIGGTSLSGGSGTIGGTIVGALIIGVLNNGMSLLGVSSFYQLIIKGLIISLAVWFDVLQKKNWTG
ncbi:sugar ABC transporter permease [Bradyrhizobium erythrophlei]|uniref:Xylose ABC transporter membrane protein n=1 Tax=Bradyrhizobium erythrophlei TaxID=1437360 RepID=A0A1M7ULJ1_9BRAD|nr:inner-membrane translocator [Bradyrhizobium erythrophlei]SHN83765.1 xylose ABC transporter membrane protein [Bradyrhizobium erythrophlei]